jgi:long-chain acyl-CoA synthetase
MEYYGYGILQTGAQNIPIYPTITEDDYEYILNHSRGNVLFSYDAEILQK